MLLFEFSDPEVYLSFQFSINIFISFHSGKELTTFFVYSQYKSYSSSFITVNDALDDILAGSDDEEEEAAIVNKVLDEIGIEISGKVFFRAYHVLSLRPLD